MIVTRAPHRVSYFGGGSDMIDHFTLKPVIQMSLVQPFACIVTLQLSSKRFQQKQNLDFPTIK